MDDPVLDTASSGHLRNFSFWPLTLVPFLGKNPDIIKKMKQTDFFLS